MTIIGEIAHFLNFSVDRNRENVVITTTQRINKHWRGHRLARKCDVSENKLIMRQNNKLIVSVGNKLKTLGTSTANP
jgi:hypothetical protein